MNTAEHIERLKRDLAGYEKYANEARLNLGAVETIRAKYPDVEPAFVRRYKYNNKGGYSDYENVQIWESYDAAADANIVDPLQLSVDQNEMASPNFATHVLYVNVPTAHGIVRVYSAKHVDLVAGFERFQNENYATLAFALQSTESEARAAFLKRLGALSAAEDARNEKEAARKKAEAAAKVQPVVVVGTVTVRQEQTTGDATVSVGNTLFVDN